jgi:hypothetical protein
VKVGFFIVFLWFLSERDQWDFNGGKFNGGNFNVAGDGRTTGSSPATSAWDRRCSGATSPLPDD